MESTAVVFFKSKVQRVISKKSTIFSANQKYFVNLKSVCTNTFKEESGSWLWDQVGHQSVADIFFENWWSGKLFFANYCSRYFFAICRSGLFFLQIVITENLFSNSRQYICKFCKLLLRWSVREIKVVKLVLVVKVVRGSGYSGCLGWVKKIFGQNFASD